MYVIQAEQQKLNYEYISLTHKKDANQRFSILKNQTRAKELKWQHDQHG